MTELGPEREARVQQVSDAIFELWRNAAFYQTEAGLIFGRVVTGDSRVPDAGEVRGFIHAVVHGDLVKPPPAPPKPKWKEWLGL